MPAALHSRDEIVARIMDVFRERGYDGASLADLSAATGLGKGSLYHHFPGGKDEMATAVLARIDAWMQANIFAPLRSTASPKARLRAMIRTLDDYYVGGRNACVLGNLVVGASRGKFQGALRAAFSGWIDALRDVALDAGIARADAQQRAEDAVVRIEGALVVAHGLDDPAPFKRALRNIERELLS